MSLSGKQILITGGSGSFGRAFLHTLFARHKPKRVVIFSRDEHKHFDMQQQFSRPEMRYFLGDVRDVDRLKRAFNNIDLIVHAAALKHVPAAEYNPIECIMTNVLGAENVIKAALDCDVPRVIALSTDKAVNPINLYGAAKLCADKLFVAANNLAGKGRTRFSIVRYGNVTGSRGSVVPLFQKLRDSGVIPITDERMTRFWISLPDSVSFVMSCVNRMRGGEIFIPKLPSMRILDLARVIAPLCRHQIVGIRPGEKVHEVLLSLEESRHAREFEKFYTLYSPTLSQSIEHRRGGKPVPEDFEYSSATNTRWMTDAMLKRALA